MISAKELKIKINIAAERKEPFLFALDYEMSRAIFIENPLSKKEQDILWRVGKYSNNKGSDAAKGSYFNRKPITLEKYRKQFNYVMSQLLKGNSFLANLTIKTEIETDYTLEDIFKLSNSQYALYIKDKLVCFSPETFVRIESGIITSNPMKGTISGDIENAEEIILNDYKESAEHNTIVDFIRSDLSRVSSNIKVERLRYIDRLKTSNGDILQVSSLISGELKEDKLGDIIFKLLPAGSISGAPKKSTVEILRHAEGEPRGFYTGVFGYFDGENLDSAVMIRYIEKEGSKLFFRSGGGVTINSLCIDEYDEAIKKIYLPFI